MSKSYSELILLPTFEERFHYLKSPIFTPVWENTTFGSKRHINQSFYRSKEWKQARTKAIVRDKACDLGIEGRDIRGRLYVHHINEISLDDLLNGSSCLIDPENLICVSFNTHQAITVGSEDVLFKIPEPRRKGDTCPWKEAF